MRRLTLAAAVVALFTTCYAVLVEPWQRVTILAEGAERVIVERREASAFPDPVTEYRVFFSHDRGRDTHLVTEGRTEDLDRQLRPLRLPDGRLCVATISEVCVEVSRTVARCHQLYTDAPLPSELRPFVERLAADPAVEPSLRERAARALRASPAR